MAKTREKMNSFLDSFDEKITIDSDLTHKSIDNKPNTVEEEPTLTRFSNLRMSDLSPESKRDYQNFQKDGYVIMENLMSPADLDLLQRDTRNILNKSPFGENAFYGAKTKRSHNLLDKTTSLLEVLSCDRVNTLVDSLFAVNALLSALQLIEIHPGEIPQKLHYDQQFQNLHPSRDPFSSEPYLLNFMIAIDDFTPENGGTVFLPGSHLWEVGRLPTEHDEKISLTMKAGSFCAFSGLLWHGGGENKTLESRRGIVAVFVQPWFRPLENYFLSVPYKKAITFPPVLLKRMGYSLHHPFTGQVDFQHPMKKLQELAKL